jgi:hypothetical protein
MTPDEKVNDPQKAPDPQASPVYEITPPCWCAIRPDHEIPADHECGTDPEPQASKG